MRLKVLAMIGWRARPLFVGLLCAFADVISMRVCLLVMNLVFVLMTVGGSGRGPKNKRW